MVYNKALKSMATTTMEDISRVWSSAKDVFWSSSFWFPPGNDWNDLKGNETVYYPDVNDLYYPIPMAVGLLVVRLLWER